jgi:endonuclease-3
MSGAEKEITLILSKLKRRYPEEMKTSLSYSTPWELLVATILSAQTTDAQVDKATPKLFKKYPNPSSFVNLRPSQLYPYTKSINIYRNKSKNIINSARMIEAEFGGKVPDRVEELIKLPGVGRKTANVVMANAFAKNEGIAIDTHCITVANRLFLYKTQNPSKLEEKLMKIIPKKEWGNATHLFIALGRDTCTSRRAHCERCVLNRICPSSSVE